LRHGAGTSGEHHPLAQRRVIVGRDERVASAPLHVRCECQRIRDDPARGVAGRGELRRLRDVLAEHEMRLQGRPESVLLQRGFGGAAVRRVFGVGDGEAAHAATCDEPRQAGEAGRGIERGAGRREQHDPAHAVERAASAGESGGGEGVHEGFVRRQEELERRAVLDLAGERARRSEHRVHALPGVACELPRDLREGDIQVRRRRDDRRPLRPDGGRESGDQRQHEGHT
jgi:hypothetical protein